MSDRPMPPIPKGLELTPEQIEAISGGDGCSVAVNLKEITDQLMDSYNNLVDFTSYVMERVANSLP